MADRKDPVENIFVCLRISFVLFFQYINGLKTDLFDILFFLQQVFELIGRHSLSRCFRANAVITPHDGDRHLYVIVKDMIVRNILFYIQIAKKKGFQRLCKTPLASVAQLAVNIHFRPRNFVDDHFGDTHSMGIKAYPFPTFGNIFL